MARAVEPHWPVPLSGLVITRYGHGARAKHLEIIEARIRCPTPMAATWRLRNEGIGQGPNPDDLVLCLISVGGSALLAAPAPGLTLDKQLVEHAVRFGRTDLAR